MRGGGFRIGQVLGIPIYVHPSWFFIFLLIFYYLSSGFAANRPEWSPALHWTTGLVTSLLFFGSVLFHELAHSVVALHYKIPVVSITLFIFGGIARISREPRRPSQEFLIAVAGPVSSYFLAAAFGLLYLLGPEEGFLATVGGWLALTNAILATFNLVPGFPLDGGRILRSIAWGLTGSYNRSTRIAARSGQAIAYGMIALGLVAALWSGASGGPVLDGLWLAFIGWFLLTAARQSYAYVTTRGALEGLRVADIMTAEIPTVGRDLSLEEYGQEVGRTGRRAHLVVDDGTLLGLMTLEALQSVPRDEWPLTSVQAAMLTRERLFWAAPEESVLELLERMQNADVQQMAVVNNGSVIGLVTRDAILQVAQTRAHLGQLAG